MEVYVQPTCHYCNERIGSSEAAKLCPECGTVYHLRCYAEHEGCEHCGYVDKEYSITCPNCGVVNIKKNNRCKVCDALLNPNVNMRYEGGNIKGGEGSIINYDYVKRNIYPYMQSFQKILIDKEKSAWNWNLGACLFGWIWCIYRKVYKWAGVLFAIWLFLLLVPLPGFLFLLLSLAIAIGWGFYASYVYAEQIYKYSRESDAMISQIERDDHLKRLGGTNTLIVILIGVLLLAAAITCICVFGWHSVYKFLLFKIGIKIE